MHNIKLFVAGNDRTGDLGAEIRRSAAARLHGRAPESILPVISALRLSRAGSDEEYQREFVRLMRCYDAIDTADFDIPRAPGFFGEVKTRLKKLLWKITRYQYYRLVFKQGVMNRMFTNALECELAIRSRECAELKHRIERLEASASTLLPKDKLRQSSVDPEQA